MNKLYRITPLEKKNVEYFVDVFEKLPDGTDARVDHAPATLGIK